MREQGAEIAMLAERMQGVGNAANSITRLAPRPHSIQARLTGVHSRGTRDAQKRTIPDVERTQPDESSSAHPITSGQPRQDEPLAYGNTLPANTLGLTSPR